MTPQGRRRFSRHSFGAIAEPATTITDYLLAALTAVFAVLLLRRGVERDALPVLLWGAAFVTTSLSALLGGTVHGFAPRLGEARQKVLWKGVLLLIGLTDFLLVSAASVAVLQGKARAALLVFAVLKLAAYLAWIRTRDDFAVAALDSGVALLVLLGLQIQLAVEQHAPGAPWIIAGVLLSLAGAGVQRSGFRLHRHFNHNDIFHVVQMGGAYLLYRGGLLL